MSEPTVPRTAIINVAARRDMGQDYALVFPLASGRLQGAVWACRSFLALAPSRRRALRLARARLAFGSLAQSFPLASGRFRAPPSLVAPQSSAAPRLSGLARARLAFGSLAQSLPALPARLRALLGLAAALADLAHDRGGADDGDRSASGRDRRLLLRYPPAGYGTVAGPLVQQHPERLGVRD